jgi:dTDP-4-amino-4,6-dideoxygalactose transaminase
VSTALRHTDLLGLPAVLGGTPAFADTMPLVRPTLDDVPALAARITGILESGMLTNASTVRELEETVAQRLGVDHVIAVANCTSGLMLTLQALGIHGPVVLPSFTFAASAHAIAWTGGTPRFAEVLPDALTLDPEDALARLDGAAAMTATHVYGTPCQVERLQDVADQAGIPLVYDAAHALGSKRRGVPVGRFGAAEVFSLSPTKVTVAGEGGLVSTDDPELARKIRIGRDYGNPGSYDCEFAGINARMSEMHAAIALHNLASLDERIVLRNALVDRFHGALEGLPGVSWPRVDDGDVSTYKDMTLILDLDHTGLSAQDLAVALSAEGVDSRRYYHPPIHRQRAYAHLRHEDLPTTDRIAESVLTVPLWSHSTADQIDGIAAAIRRILGHGRAVARAVGENAA